MTSLLLSLVLSLAAGAASALMFASLLSGAVISLLLFYLAPLPLLVVALGWSAPHAAIGGIAAGSGLGALFGLPYLVAFVVAIVLPACWLGHLANLGRPGDDRRPAEFYPPGRLLLWVVVLSAVTAGAALLTLGSDAAEIRDSLRRGLSRMVGARGLPVPQAEKGSLLEAFVNMAPAAAAIVAVMTLALNAWLAGRITRTSGRLKRDWPDLSQTMLPPMTLVALPAALAFCFGDSLFAMAAQIVAASLMMAYALTGLATVHALTKGRAQRGLWLAALYAALIVFGWPVIGLVALGLTDAFFGLRNRAQSGPSP